MKLNRTISIDRKILISSLGAFLFLTSAPIHAEWKQAVAAYNQGKFEKCIQEIKPDVEANPTWETGHRILGLSYLNTKKYDLAEASLSRAVQLKSKSFSTYFGLAEAYAKLEKTNKIPEVLSAGEKFAQTSDDKYNLHHLRGSIYFRQKKYADAVRDLTEAVRAKPNEVADLYPLGLSHYFAGNFQEAILTLNKVTGAKPNDSTIRTALGNSYQKLGANALKNKQYAKAAEDLEKAVEFNPKDGTTHYNLGLANLFLSKLDKAESAFQKAGELLPDNADIPDRLGYVYEKRKQYPQALEAYKKSYGLKKDTKVKASIDRVNELMKGPPAGQSSLQNPSYFL